MTTRKKTSARNNSKIPPEVLRVIQSVAEEAAEKAAKRAAYRAVRDVVKDVAQIAVYETLTSLGIKSDTPDSRNEVAFDAKFVRRLRTAAETRPAKYGFALFTALMSAASALVVIAVQQFIAPWWGR
jgi:hypothetical protein